MQTDRQTENGESRRDGTGRGGGEVEGTTRSKRKVRASQDGSGGTGGGRVLARGGGGQGGGS